MTATNYSTSDPHQMPSGSYFQVSTSNTNTTTMSPTESPPTFLSPHHPTGSIYGSISGNEQTDYHHPSGVVIKMEYHDDYDQDNLRPTTANDAAGDAVGSPQSDFYNQGGQLGPQFVSTTMLDLNSQQQQQQSQYSDLQTTTADTFYTTLRAGTPTLAILTNSTTSPSSQIRSRSNSNVSGSGNKRQRCGNTLPTSQSYHHHHQQQQLHQLHQPSMIILDPNSINESQLDHHKLDSFQAQHLNLSASELIHENSANKTYQSSLMSSNSYYGETLWPPSSSVQLLTNSAASEQSIKKELSPNSPPNSSADSQPSPSSGGSEQLLVYGRMLSNQSSSSPSVLTDNHVQFHYHPSATYTTSQNGN